MSALGFVPAVDDGDLGDETHGHPRMGMSM